MHLFGKMGAGKPQIHWCLHGGECRQIDLPFVQFVAGLTSQPVEKRAMLVRMLRNLQSLAGRDRDLPALLRYLDAVLTITPDSADDRMYRAVYRYQGGSIDGREFVSSRPVFGIIRNGVSCLEQRSTACDQTSRSAVADH